MSLFSKPKQKKKKLTLKENIKEWINAITFAVIAATLLRWFLLEAYTIPTPSMEKSLLVGDYLFVSKFHYGARTPKTLLQVPLTHQKIWGTNLPSYLDFIQLPQIRFPGISEIKRNDVVVFNWPPDDYPLDLKTYYIKRCVGLPGDEFKVADGRVIINNNPEQFPEERQTSYLVKSQSRINERVLEKYDITDYYGSANGLLIHTKPEVAEKLKSLNFINQVEPIKHSPVGRKTDLFMRSNYLNWTIDELGPFLIPKKGETISIDSLSISLYGDMIRKYEGNANIVVNEKELLIDNNSISSYTFKKNYYFMMGDNRHNSLDSRSWGFVPEDHILGKALFIWLSLDPSSKNSLFDKVRWNRIFKIVE